MLLFLCTAVTGSEFLQRAMRTRAHKLGLSMSQHGLRLKDKADTFLPASEFRTERDVFNKLGLECVPPCLLVLLLLFLLFNYFKILQLLLVK